MNGDIYVLMYRLGMKRDEGTGRWFLIRLVEDMAIKLEQPVLKNNLMSMLQNPDGLWFIYPMYHQIFDGRQVQKKWFRWGPEGMISGRGIADDICWVGIYKKKYLIHCLDKKEQPKPEHVALPDGLEEATSPHKFIYVRDDFYHFIQKDEKLYLQRLDRKGNMTWKELSGDIPESIKLKPGGFDKKGVFMAGYIDVPGSSGYNVGIYRLEGDKLKISEIFKLEGNVQDFNVIGRENDDALLIYLYSKRFRGQRFCIFPIKPGGEKEKRIIDKIMLGSMYHKLEDEN